MMFWKMLKVANKNPEKYEQILQEMINLEKPCMESATQIFNELTNKSKL